MLQIPREEFTVDALSVWPTSGLQRDAKIVDIPQWVMVPDIIPRSSSVPTVSNHHHFLRSGSEPLEMKLFDELWTGQIPNSDSLPQPEPQPPPTFLGSVDRSPPSRTSAISAISMVDAILQPPRATGRGYRPVKLNSILKSRLVDMQSVLRLFVRHGEWMEDSEQIAVTRGRGPYYGRILRHWIKAFIIDTTSLPTNAWGTGNVSHLDTEPNLREELCEHLRSIGKYVKAQDVIDHLNRPEVKAKYSASLPLSLKTAQRWMETLGYTWANTPTGCYVDGHERDDVVNYRQNIFLPAWFAKEPRLRVWTDENINDPAQSDPSTGNDVFWYHDETVNYAHDRRQLRWVPHNETAVPRPKGEGHSLMVADFISADYGWLQSPDGTESARVLIRPGARRDGYFTHDDVIAQVTKAMDILRKFYPHDNHIFIFDNASTHVKRAHDAISARNMPVNTPASGKNWFVKTPSLDENSNQIFNANGKKLMKSIPMAPGAFADGSPQPFYFPDGHERAGKFKGMRAIVEERGFSKEQLGKLKRECPSFHCPVGKTDCCIRRLLYSQPDFQGVKSALEDHCAQCGFKVIFLPKFHPELNPIEQCWGRAKWYYRQLPPSSKECDLERNVLESLNSVTTVHIRRWVFVSSRVSSYSILEPGTRTGQSGSWTLTDTDLMLRQLLGPAKDITAIDFSHLLGWKISTPSTHPK